MSAPGKPKMQLAAPAVLPADEQALLVAYRTMDDEARGEILRMARRRAITWPAPTQRGPRLMSMPATAMSLLHDFCSTDDQGRERVTQFARFIKTQSERRQSSLPPALQLVIGGKS